MTQLLTALHTNTLAEEVRHMAAVILRRLFSSEFQEFYIVVSTIYTYIAISKQNNKIPNELKFIHVYQCLMFIQRTCIYEWKQKTINSLFVSINKKSNFFFH